MGVGPVSLGNRLVNEIGSSLKIVFGQSEAKGVGCVTISICQWVVGVVLSNLTMGVVGPYHIRGYSVCSSAPTSGGWICQII